MPMSTKTKSRPTPVETVATEQPELQQVSNQPEMVKAFGKTYRIARFTIGQLGEALEYAPYITAAVAEAQKLFEGGRQPSQGDLIRVVGNAIAISGPAFMGLLTIATREPVEFIEEQEDSIVGLELFAKVVEKNLDFFTPENRERLSKAFGGLLKQINPVGGA